MLKKDDRFVAMARPKYNIDIKGIVPTQIFDREMSKAVPLT